MTIDPSMRVALEHQRAGRIRQAEDAYRRILANDPDHAEALEGLGVLLSNAGAYSEAIERLQNAIRHQPRSIDAHRFLSRALLDSGQLDDALLVLENLLRICPDDPAEWNNLGAIQAALNRLVDATTSFRMAIALQPGYRPAIVNLANALADTGRDEEVVRLCRQALDIDPDDSSTRFLLSAVAGKQFPDIAPRDYVTRLFDNSATFFDDQAESLEYRGPDMLRAAFDEVASRNAGRQFDLGHLDVIDLGCGTGLCGAAFRDVAGTLIGVDLSACMMQRAQQKGLYTQLLVGELAAVLGTMPDAFDLVLAADVFIYIGDLRGVFNASRASLRSGGLFAFTVETTGTASQELRPTRRYAHSHEYLRSLASGFGFEVAAMNSAPLRMDHERPIEGAAYVLRRKT